jgi:hypothetical protein
MAFDRVASAVAWLDSYRARSPGLLDLYAEDAAECPLIRDLATARRKREPFDRPAAHLITLAAEVDRHIAKGKAGDGAARFARPPATLHGVVFALLGRRP